MARYLGLSERMPRFLTPSLKQEVSPRFFGFAKLVLPKAFNQLRVLRIARNEILIVFHTPPLMTCAPLLTRLRTEDQAHQLSKEGLRFCRAHLILSEQSFRPGFLLLLLLLWLLLFAPPVPS